MAGLLNPYQATPPQRAKKINAKWNGNTLTDAQGNTVMQAPGLLDAAEQINQFLPVTGDIQAGLLAANDVKQGNYGSAALNSLGLLPFVPALGATVGRKLTKYELAHLKAQENATKMLGLPPDNTAMDRAKALGFDVNNPAFHGTNKDIEKFDVNLAKGKTYNTGIWLTNNPDSANTYTMGINQGNVMPLLVRDNKAMTVEANSKNWNRLAKNTKVSAPKIYVKDNETDDLLVQLGMPNESLLKRKKFSKTLGKMFPDDFMYDDYFTTDDLARFARNQGYDSTKFNNVVDIGPTGMFVNEKAGMANNNQVIYKPELLRSRFAAFDPERINEPDLLGAATPEMLGLLAAGSLGGLGAINYLNRNNGQNQR